MKRSLLILVLFMLFATLGNAQDQIEISKANTSFVNSISKRGFSDLFGTRSKFIENVGQYSDTLSGYGYMGKILFAYEGLDMPILFTDRGVLHLQKRVKKPSDEEIEKMNEEGVPLEIIAQKTKTISRVITMEWLNANQKIEIGANDIAPGYQTYGKLQAKAYGYKKLIYKNVYAGIDINFSFNNDNASGFEYSLVIHPNADLANIQFVFGGDLKKLQKDKVGNLIIKSDISSFIQTAPKSFYSNEEVHQNSDTTIASKFVIKENKIGFLINANYDHSKELTIDPFVTNTVSLTGTNAGKAKDVDFDYSGNVYVTGGGDGNVHMVAKFNAAGVLQWTFTGTTAVPAWTFGPYYGGWVVEKNTGNIYLGQGFNPTTGYQVIRLNAAGLYDNFITVGNTNANEDWKMFWSCNNGSPQILIAGGGTSGNLNLGVLTPPSTVITGINLTGLVGGCCQDMVDMAFDPNTLDIYQIYASLGGMPFVNNRLYKNAYPYSASSILWNTLSGYTTLSEANNRPYMSAVGAAFSDNSANVVAMNANYLFYWDGLNLKAFNKATGAGVGTAITIAGNTAMMQGGIVVDECNNVFIGSTNGTIKVYTFNGVVFNDIAAPDITIPGFANKSVYDIVNNDAQHLLYACGDGFVAALDISAYNCGNSAFNLSVNTVCSTKSATASISPLPPAGSTISYFLYNGSLLLSSNTNGIFNGLTPGINYSIHAFINQACSGIESIINFTILAPVLTVTTTNTTCGTSSGSITANATGGTGALQYSINGTTFQGSGIFNGLPSGIYTVIVKDITGCSSTATVNITNTNGPQLTLSKTNALCGSSTGTITVAGTGGTPGYQYSLDNIIFQLSPVFTGLFSGAYIVIIKDASGCTNSNSIIIDDVGGTNVSTVITPASCGNGNGSLTVTVSGGQPPYLYSIDGINFQIGNVFTGLAGGTYTLTVKAANNCINTSPFVINNLSGPQLTAISGPTSCIGFTGFITISTIGGSSPFQYSINNGATYQASNIFNSLTAGTYTFMVKDANGCINTGTITVNLSLPQITDSTTTTACAINNGTITAIATGGNIPYQYSIDGVTFQASNLFTGLGAGSYTLTLQDASGCINSISPVIISNTSGLVVSATSTSTSCITSTGTITSTSIGGAAPIQFAIDASTFQVSGNFSGLAAGNHTITAKDVNGCTSKIVVKVNSILTPTVIASTTSTSCNSINGSITASGLGGTAPYQYSINGITFQAGNVFANLAPGPYTITIRDANLCTNTISVLVSNIGSGTGPTVTATSISAECGQSNGRIDANGSGGKNPKKYSIDGSLYQGSTTFNNVLPGVYTVYVQDANGCINTTTVTVGNFSGPQVSATVTTASCAVNNGTITALGFGGTAPYRYSIDGGLTFQVGTSFTGLSSGFYTLIVRDADNVCRNNIIVTIGNSNGPSIAVAKTNASCAVNNGKIVVNGAGGNPPYTYSLDGVNFQNSNTFQGLASGQYVITVKDVSSCANTLISTITSIAAPQVSIVPSASSCGKNNGSIILNGSAGTPPYSYSIDGINFQSNHLFSGLNSGSYIATILDSNNCTSRTNLTLVDVPGPQVTTTAFSSTCSNSNGKLFITGNGGTLPYEYSLDGITYQSSFIFSNLLASNKTATIRDANLCTASVSATIPNIGGPSLNLTTIPGGCGAGEIQAIAAGGTLPFQYTIDSINYQASSVFTCLPVGSYTVTVKDSNLCRASAFAILLGSTLPISLLSFDATPDKNIVNINWVTASEKNNDYFTIERSKNGELFEPILVKKGAGTSNLIHQYTAVDLTPYNGISYYRLKQTDFDGEFTYSKIVCVRMNGSLPAIHSAYNANEHCIDILLNNHFDQLLSIELVDMIGKRIKNEQLLVNEKLKFNVPELASGIYFLNIYNENAKEIQRIEVR